MEEPLSRGASPASDGGLTGGVEMNATIVTALDDRLLDISMRHSLNALKTPPARKAKRVRFFRNGDKFYTGVVMAVAPERYRSFDSLATDLTRALISSVTLPNGVRAIYTMDGRKVQSINDLEDGKCYVCSGQGEIFKKVEYSSSKVRRGSSLSGLPQSPVGTGRSTSAIPQCVKARIVTFIRHGTKPRKVVRLLLSKRNAPSLEHALEAITDAVKLDSGAVRKVYTLSGQQITSLEQFFESEEIFLAYGNEKSNQEDFELDFEESKSVQSFRKGPWISKRQNGPMPRMPRKSGKKTLSAPQVRTPSPASLLLPQPLRLHYAVGHIIGDGNFAVVRHCIHKTTGQEYAMKIVDKYKCQGKETMLASEVAILRQVCHPNIISLIAEQETTDQLFLVMELVKGGDLFDAIAAATKFSEAEASVMIGHLTSALAYLHSHHIVHRDVKPENLLVEMESNRVRCLKLGDFGLAQVVREPLYTVCGTPTYVAPEILAETGYGLKIDVWAAGVILYILLCGYPPFVSLENEQEELFERILSGQYEFTSPYWDTVSESAKQLISNMLQPQPELRFSAEDVLDHPWLASFLGCEQTAAAATTAVASSQQYWDQQRQPIRLATFDFDYKKQRRVGVPGENGEDGLDGNTTRDRWTNMASSTTNVNARDVDYVDNDDDNVDLANGRRNVQDNNDGPISLSTDCLQDIRTLTRSMRDLTCNLDGNRDACVYPRARSSQGSNVSLSSIPESNKSASQKNFKATYGGSAINVSDGGENSTPTEVLHSVGRRNGNSMSDIHSRSLVTPSPPGCRTTRPSDTPKSSRSVGSKVATSRCNRRNLHDSLGPSINGAIETAAGNVVETDGTKDDRSSFRSGSSNNDIETSDSFVNIQFAMARRDRNSSVESTDSFENVHFAWNRDNRNAEDTRDVNENSRIDVDVQSLSLDRREEEEDTRVTVDSSNRRNVVRNARQTRSVAPANPSRYTRPSQNLVQTEIRPNSTRGTVGKGQEIVNSANEPVKRREKRYPSRTNDQVEGKCEDRNKRFSCFVSSIPKKCRESKEIGGKPNRIVTRSARKFNSTDELREEKQQQSTKQKRFSLYYTPQPLRKSYDAESITGKNAGKGMKESGGKSCLDSGKRREEISGIGERRDPGGNRRSVLEGSTAASRSRSNKQNIHIRTNATSARTK